MSLFARILGAVGAVFQIGGPTGPSLTAAGTRITASGNVAGSNPVNPQDFLTSFPKNIEGTVFVDPTNSQGWAGTDAGAWINAAFAFLETTYGSSFGGVIQLAPGQYNFATPIVCAVVGFSFILRGSGDGNGGTVLNYTATTGIALTAGGGSGNNGGVQLENFTLTGTASSNAATGIQWGVGSIGVAGATIKNVSILRFGTGENQVNGTIAYAIEHFNVKIQTCGTGCIPQGENIIWVGGLIGGCTTAVFVNFACEIQLFGTAFDDNTTEAFSIANAAARITCSGCRFENPSLGTSAYVVISAGTFAMFGGGFQEDNTTGTATGFIQQTGGKVSVLETWCYSAGRTMTQLVNASGTSQIRFDPVIAPSATGISTYVNGSFAVKPIDWVQLSNRNGAIQSQVVVAGTAYYITNSNLDIPTAQLQQGIAVGTTFTWRVWLTKTAAGTAAFDIIIFAGTNGTSADTAEVTESIGTSTAVADTMLVDIVVKFLTVGSSGSFFWAMSPMNKAATITGFGVATGTASYSGTVTAFNTTTTNLIFGLGFKQTTGTPTITVPLVEADAKYLY